MPLLPPAPGVAPATRRMAEPMRPADPVRLTPGKRVLFLTKDPEKIRAQLAGTLDLTMDDVAVEDLLDDVNTDAMTPAWVCFDHDPADIAKQLRLVLTSPTLRSELRAAGIERARQFSWRKSAEQLNELLVLNTLRVAA